MPQIIGLIGPARAGKTTLATSILDQVGSGAVLHFADPIRNALSSVGVTKEGTPTLYRKLAQLVGQSCRDFDRDWWVNRFEIDLEAQPDDVLILIDDVRYQNEIDLLKHYGATLIFVDAHDRIDLTEEFRAHESEAIPNILHGELSEAHHIVPALTCVHSVYLDEGVWVVRNIDGKERDAASLIAQTFVLRGG